MEQLGVVTLMKFKNTVERILHVKGNYQGGILEMAVVADCKVSKEQLKSILPKLISALKSQGETFRNVRFNFVSWKSDTEIQNKVCPMMTAFTEEFYQFYVQTDEEKSFLKLVEYLKVFQARAKLIIVIGDKIEITEQKEEIKKSMQPFLDKKLMLVVEISKEQPEIKYREL